MGSASALGIATIDTASGRTLDAFYPAPALQRDPQPVPGLATTSSHDVLRGVDSGPVTTVIEDLDRPPEDTEDAYLRLHLLSHRLVRPNEINLEGIFGVLPNVAWTNLGPVEPEQVAMVRMRCRGTGRPFEVLGVDKFPRMTDYVVPSGVRIADATRVRLGAHLAPGTTVMHEGFCNFNAGTLGTSTAPTSAAARRSWAR
jgi:2,3,4,5-tetrahydropyridine-2,6-dicarboxylate N-succinyltransferase